MRDFILQKHFNLSMFVVGVLFGAILFWTQFAGAIGVTSISPPLTTGDVNSDKISDGTIVDADVSPVADISGRKIKTSGTTATVLLTDGTRIATTTGLKFATSTADLYVFGGRINATSTNFNGVNHTWPSADGAASTGLQTDGAGNLSWVSVASSLINITIATDEPLVAGSAVTMATGTQMLRVWAMPSYSSDTGAAYGHTGGSTCIAQSFTPLEAVTTSGVRVELYKVASPTDNSNISLRPDNAGVPSTIIYGVGTTSNSSLTTTPTPTNIYFSTTTLTASTKYWMVFCRSGGVDGTNYPVSRFLGAGFYAGHSRFAWDGATWTDQGGDDMPFELITLSTPGRVIRSSGINVEYGHGFLGFSSGTFATGTSATITVAGVATGLSGLTAGGKYYLANATSSLSLTPGTFLRKACWALSATTCLIKDNW